MTGHTWHRDKEDILRTVRGSNVALITSACGEGYKGATSAKVQLLSGPPLPVCKVGTVTPTLPAMLGGTWGSGSQRILQHAFVLCAFPSVHRCTKKGTISKGDGQQMGSLGRRGEGEGFSCLP